MHDTRRTPGIIPGVNGLALSLGTANPKAGVQVQLLATDGTVVGAATTDGDGFYVIPYKHKGKTAKFTVKLPDWKVQRAVELKGNGQATAIFDELP